MGINLILKPLESKSQVLMESNIINLDGKIIFNYLKRMI